MQGFMLGDFTVSYTHTTHTYCMVHFPPPPQTKNPVLYESLTCVGDQELKPFSMTVLNTIQIFHSGLWVVKYYFSN